MNTDKRLFILFVFQILILVISPEEYSGLYVQDVDDILFHNLYNALISEDFDKKFDGVVELRKLIASPDPPYEGLEKTAVLQRLVEFLSSEKDNIQDESALAIATLCSKGYSHHVVIAHGIEYLFDTFGSRNITTVQQGILAFGYIMSHNPDFRDKCVDEGIVFHLNRLVFSSKTPDFLLKNISWAISNFFVGTDEYMDEEAVREILPALSALIQHNDHEIVQHAVMAYGYLAAGGGKYIQLVIDSGRIGNIIASLNHTDEKVQFSAAGVLAILFTGNHQQIQQIINHGALQKLIQLLIHPTPDLKKNSLQAINNLVTYGTSKQIQALLDLNVISLICDLLDNCSRTVVKASLDIIHLLLGKSDDIREVINRHVTEWGGLEKMEKIMDKTISRLHNEDNKDFDQGTCSR
uniref:Uncharacterized protein n=1 Tax=Panagrolaimus superbus TaxID=310955 RepID=A0A914YB00_9BILA